MPKPRTRGSYVHWHFLAAAAVKTHDQRVHLRPEITNHLRPTSRSQNIKTMNEADDLLQPSTYESAERILGVLRNHLLVSKKDLGRLMRKLTLGGVSI